MYKLRDEWHQGGCPYDYGVEGCYCNCSPRVQFACGQCYLRVKYKDKSCPRCGATFDERHREWQWSDYKKQHDTIQRRANIDALLSDTLVPEIPEDGP